MAVSPNNSVGGARIPASLGSRSSIGVSSKAARLLGASESLHDLSTERTRSRVLCDGCVIPDGLDDVPIDALDPIGALQAHSSDVLAAPPPSAVTSQTPTTSVRAPTSFVTFRITSAFLPVSDPVQICLHLYDRRRRVQLTDDHLTMASPGQTSIASEWISVDLGEVPDGDLAIVCRLYTIQQRWRRPLGVGIIPGPFDADLHQLLIHTPAHDRYWARLHDRLLQLNGDDPTSQDLGSRRGRAFCVQIETRVDQHPAGDQRLTVYDSRLPDADTSLLLVRVHQLDMSSSSVGLLKKSQMNVGWRVSVTCCNDVAYPSCLRRHCNGPLLTTFDGTLLYHASQAQVDEQFTIDLNALAGHECTIAMRFELQHCTTTQKKRHTPLGYAVVPFARRLSNGHLVLIRTPASVPVLHPSTGQVTRQSVALTTTLWSSTVPDNADLAVLIGGRAAALTDANFDAVRMDDARRFADALLPVCIAYAERNPACRSCYRCVFELHAHTAPDCAARTDPHLVDIALRGLVHHYAGIDDAFAVRIHQIANDIMTGAQSTSRRTYAPDQLGDALEKVVGDPNAAPALVQDLVPLLCRWASLGALTARLLRRVTCPVPFIKSCLRLGVMSTETVLSCTTAVESRTLVSLVLPYLAPRCASTRESSLLADHCQTILEAHDMSPSLSALIAAAVRRLSPSSVRVQQCGALLSWARSTLARSAFDPNQVVMRVLEIGAVADLIEAISLDCDLVPVVLAALTVADMDLHGVRRRRAAYIVKHLIGIVRPRLLHVLATLVQALSRDTPITVDDDDLLEQVTRHVMTLGEHQDLVLHDLYNRLIERVPTGKRQMIVDAALGALRSSGRSLAELSRSCSTWLRSQTLTLHANAVDLLAAASDLSTSRRHEDQVAGLVEQALSQLEGVEARQLRQTAADILIRLHGALGNDPELSAAFRLRAEQYPGNDPRRSQEMLRARQTFVECNEYERAASICDRLMFGYTGPDADPGSCRAVRAELVDRMHSEDRLYPLYCRALFSRSTRWHDPSVSDREFVYRLDVGETVLEFTNRIRIVYPYAKVVNTSSSTWTWSTTSTMTMAGAVDTAGDNATILVCRCHVVAQFAMPESAPVRARERLTMTDSSQFSYTYCPGPGAVSNVTTTRTVISVRDRFPCLFRRQPVVARRTETVTALQAALEQVQEKTASIARCCDYVEGDTKDTPGRINALSMQLNGTIDAAVNGGLEVYRASFLSDKYKADHPEDASQVDALRNACTAQVAVLHRGLTVMERVMCADLEPLYKHLRRALNAIHQQWTQQ